MVIPQTQGDTVVAWATNMRYPSRIHMTNGRDRVSLCGFPINTVTRYRPSGLWVCPDCDAYVEVSFPADSGAGQDCGAADWFRRLPPTQEGNR